MPEKRFRMHSADAPAGIDQVRHLADVFGTSISAAAFRLLDLNLLPPPAAVFRWDALGQLSGRRMSPQTPSLAPEFRRLPLRPPSDSVTRNVIDHLSAGIHRGRSSVRGWFPGLHGYGNYDDLKLREEVMSLSAHGWLTVIWNDEGTSSCATG